MATNKSSLRVTVGLLFIIDFLITIVILFTDNNLQTDFGSVPKYFIHWYGLLSTAIIDIIGAGIVFSRPGRGAYAAGFAGSALLALFLILDTLTYSMVGFSSITSFATYLFGFTKYHGSLSYIPGLYDILLIFYFITAIVSAYAMKSVNKSAPS